MEMDAISIFRAMPKSPSLKYPCSETKIFSGLMSRWMIPSASQAFRALEMSIPIRMTSSSDSVPHPVSGKMQAIGKGGVHMDASVLI